MNNTFFRFSRIKKPLFAITAVILFSAIIILFYKSLDKPQYFVKKDAITMPFQEKPYAESYVDPRRYLSEKDAEFMKSLEKAKTHLDNIADNLK